MECGWEGRRAGGGFPPVCVIDTPVRVAPFPRAHATGHATLMALAVGIDQHLAMLLPVRHAAGQWPLPGGRADELPPSRSTLRIRSACSLTQPAPSSSPPLCASFPALLCTQVTMNLFQRSDYPKRANSMPSVSRLRMALLGGKKSRANGHREGTISYADATTQLESIGEQPHAPVRSSRTFALSWRFPQVNVHTEQAKSKADAGLCNTALSTPSVRKPATSRMPIADNFQPLTTRLPLLHNRPSMRFPKHSCAQSQPTAASLCLPGSLPSPSIGTMVDGGQPHTWWQATTASSAEREWHAAGTAGRVRKRSSLQPVQPALHTHQTSLSLDAALQCMSNCSSSKPSIPSRWATGEASPRNASLDDSSTPSLEVDLDSSEDGSSPTLCHPLDSLYTKDPCQSPVPHLFALADESVGADQSQSVEDWGEDPDGLVVADLEESIKRFVGAEEPGRQERLHRWSSVEQLLAVSSTLPRTSTPVTPQSVLKIQRSLTDFLHELQREEESDESSVSSGSLDDDGDISAQICRAWRGNIALAGVGASLANAHLNFDKSPRLLHKHSQMSAAIDLDTIQEASVISWQDSIDDSLEHFDLCAHLLKRAREDPAVLPRKTI